jgi:hypothetical protein
MSTYQADWFLDESGNFDGRAAEARTGVRSDKAIDGEEDIEVDDDDEADGEL